jgi:uncharacterized protein YceK
LIDVDEIQADIQCAGPGRMKRRIFIFYILPLLPVLLSGCASISARIDDEGGGGPYIGVRGDAYALAHPGETGDAMVPIFCVFDLPFSFIVDTVCLPYDLVEADKSKKFDPHQDPGNADRP